MISQYENWYRENAAHLNNDFPTNNPYSIIHTIASDVKRKILLHFPENDKLNLFPESSIFKNTEHIQNLKSMLLDMEVIDQTGKSKLTPRKGFILFGIIDSFRTSEKKLLKKVYTDDELLHFFNRQIGTNYRRIKRDSKDFKNNVATAKTFIEKYF